MKTKTLLHISLGMLLGFSTLGCGESKESVVIQGSVPTQQDVADYEAEMDATEEIEE